jgi:hypothetical protein
MKKKENLFVMVEKNRNRAIALVDSGMLEFMKDRFPIYDFLHVLNTGITSQRTENGPIISMSVYCDDDKVYYLATDWPDSMNLKQVYDTICN